MKVFLSWSGKLSQEVALLLNKWLPSVIQSIKPYMSTEMDKGTRWFSDISQELHTSCIGILCITKDNMESPWIMFEAGALAEKLDKSKVCPFLIDVKSTDLKAPLSQFQATSIEKKEILKLLETINNQLDNKLTEQNLMRYFDRWYPDLEKEINDILTSKSKPAVVKPERTERDILEEILSLNRSIINLINDGNKFMMIDDINYRFDDYNNITSKKYVVDNDIVRYKIVHNAKQSMRTALVWQTVNKYCSQNGIEMPTLNVIDNYVYLGFNGEPDQSMLINLVAKIREIKIDLGFIEIRGNSGSAKEKIIYASSPSSN